MSITGYNVKTLPKWAQEEIEILELRLLEARKQVKELTNQEPTRIEVEPYYAYGKPLSYLPDRTRIRFTVGSELPTFHNGIDVTLRDDHVEIHGADTLQINPYSSNVIHLRLSDQS